MNERVLIVDDDELVRTGLAANLEREGYEVLTAESGEKAVQLAGRRPVDIVLCDYILGGMDGIEVLKHFQDRFPGVAVVMITGQGSISNALDALRHGASDYIQKPATPEEVIHRVRTVLDAARLRSTLSAERRRAEERKRLVNEQLIRAERMVSLGLLAEGTANDLHAILQPLLKHAASIKSALPEKSAALPHLRAIEDAVEKAEAVIHDLQAIGREGRFKKRHFNINSVVDRFMKSADFARLKASNAKVRVQVSLTEVVPAIAGSDEQVQKALSILVANAYESMRGGGLVTIESASEQVDRPVGRYGSGPPGEYVILSVADTGPGMKPEDVERIFEPFYTTKFMGHRLLSGLSMALVYRVVENHGGYIDVETGAGRGTTFLVYLPVARAGEVALEVKPDYTGTERILVVDDYKAHRTAASTILEGLGYRVVTAENGRAAVQLFEQAVKSGGKESVDLAVIDLVLGDEFDGVETYKKLIEIRPGQKAILVSGFADINRIVEARKLGINRCIQKPYAADTLGRAIRQELDSE